YQSLDDEEEFMPAGDWMLVGNHENDKSSGYYRLIDGAEGKVVEELIHSAHRYTALSKAQDAETLLFRRQSYREYPELWMTDARFREPKQLTLTNPQQKDYRWGTVEMISWEAFDGRDFDGLLYKPDDFDPSKKYPVLIYFYEKTSNRLHSYSTPAPSRSIIYPSWYNSNGYVVFMPDIAYDTGEPGPDAYNSVVSGAEALIARYPWVDADNIGIQGQSWGGYQVAYLVTRTNMFKAAMAGAPVSNMTSAYGGIRWGSGRSRMFQYERTQSRLGTTLWENRTRYIENSPLFYADRVETPLLMMHNDDDGAVPWYQGIEYFVALRRLQRPVWMLVYNGEAHNLRQWPNRIDLSIRMSQFFDHYLKGEPAPKWMSQGVPATQKGKDLGYELEVGAGDRE
ncbi:MAG: prolyl oligopeptidase family serine peptidase, partial [Bacteroidota bacterium]